MKVILTFTGPVLAYEYCSTGADCVSPLDGLVVAA